MPTAANVIRAAQDLLDTPFHHQGRVPGVGLDCAGVPIVIARALELVAPDFDVTGYPRAPDGQTLQRYCAEHMLPAPAPEPGGVVLVAWGDGPPQHLGIVAPWRHGGLAMIHAESRRHHAVVMTRLQFGWSMRLAGAYRLRGVTYGPAAAGGA